MSKLISCSKLKYSLVAIDLRIAKSLLFDPMRWIESNHKIGNYKPRIQRCAITQNFVRYTLPPCFFVFYKRQEVLPFVVAVEDVPQETRYNIMILPRDEHKQLKTLLKNLTETLAPQELMKTGTSEQREKGH